MGDPSGRGSPGAEWRTLAEYGVAGEPAVVCDSKSGAVSRADVGTDVAVEIYRFRQGGNVLWEYSLARIDPEAAFVRMRPLGAFRVQRALCCIVELWKDIELWYVAQDAQGRTIRDNLELSLEAEVGDVESVEAIVESGACRVILRWRAGGTTEVRVSQGPDGRMVRVAP